MRNKLLILIMCIVSVVIMHITADALSLMQEDRLPMNKKKQKMTTRKTTTVIKHYDAATIAEVLNREIPDLVIDSITIIPTGWDHVVAEVNGEWIFRFPREETSIANLEREKRLLDYLKTRITLAIPQYHYVGTETAFVGYRKIPGIPLSTHTYTSLNLETRHSIAATLANFFTELHQAISTQQAVQWGYTCYYPPLEAIKSELFGTVPADIDIMMQKALAYAREELSKEQDFVFFHKDLHGDNLAFDATTGRITGIFDFSDAGIGPCSWEFGGLFVVHAELARLTAQSYAKINAVSNTLIGGAADCILFQASMLLQARRKGDVQDEMNWLKILHEFIPVWHNVLTRIISN